AVARHQADDLLLLRHVRRDLLDLQPLVAEPLDGGLQLLRPACRDRQRVPVLAEIARDRQPDAARASGHQCRALCHLGPPRSGVFGRCRGRVSTRAGAVAVVPPAAVRRRTLRSWSGRCPGLGPRWRLWWSLPWLDAGA